MQLSVNVHVSFGWKGNLNVSFKCISGVPVRFSNRADTIILQLVQGPPFQHFFKILKEAIQGTIMLYIKQLYVFFQHGIAILWV